MTPLEDGAKELLSLESVIARVYILFLFFFSPSLYKGWYKCHLGYIWSTICTCVSDILPM